MAGWNPHTFIATPNVDSKSLHLLHNFLKRDSLYVGIAVPDNTYYELQRLVDLADRRPPLVTMRGEAYLLTKEGYEVLVPEKDTLVKLVFILYWTPRRDVAGVKSLAVVGHANLPLNLVKLYLDKLASQNMATLQNKAAKLTPLGRELAEYLIRQR